jgi:MoxR-like ATPase
LLFTAFHCFLLEFFMTDSNPTSTASTTASAAHSNSTSDKQAEWFGQQFETLVNSIGKTIFGKRETIKLACTALFAEGHVLLEDVPGTGKTSLAKALAQSIDGRWNRIQFTPDLLPSDVTGSTIFNQGKGTFEFHPGPVFANIVLGDEINRASPKTQSALLEVMEEHQVTVDSTAYPVPRPFMVIATQNPIEFEGTYRLPEAQLDRFLLKLSLGYPATDDEVDVLLQHGKPSSAVPLSPVLGQNQVRTMVQIAEQVHVEQSIAGYCVAIAQSTRELKEVRLGVSTRGSLALLRAARVRAMASGRPFVRPDDVKALATPVLAHRLVLSPESEMRGVNSVELINRVLANVVPPRRRNE